MATQVRRFPSPFLKSLLIGGCRVCRCHPEDVVSLSFCDECGRIETVCAVTFSHKRIKKLQGVNLQYKKVFWPEEKRWVRLRISTKVGPSGRLLTLHATAACWSTVCCSRLLVLCSWVSIQGLSHRHSARALLAHCLPCRLSLSVYGQSLTGHPACLHLVVRRGEDGPVGRKARSKLAEQVLCTFLLHQSAHWRTGCCNCEAARPLCSSLYLQGINTHSWQMSPCRQ